MKNPHEWPQPPSTIKPSSLRRKLTRQSLASVDLYKADSDGDDELQTREPLETACQSSGYDEIQICGAGDCNDSQSSSNCKRKEIQITGYAGNHEDSRHGNAQEIHRSGYQDHKGFESASHANCKGFQSSDDGESKSLDFPSTTTKIFSANKEGKETVPANRRMDHSSILPHQPLRLNACPLSGALKLVGKPQTARRIIPVHVATEENNGVDTTEPFSPEVTCLGRVRMKEKQGHDSEHAHMEQQTCADLQRHVEESKKQHVDKNHKDGSYHGSSKRDIAEKRSCLPRRKKRLDVELGTLRRSGICSSAVTAPEATETRRERAAVLARSLTSLLEDLRRLDMENPGYVPAVPPPNSLLLMRGFGILNKSCNRDVPTLLHENAFRSDDNISRIPEHSHKGISAKGAQKVLPLSEIEGNSLVQNASPSEINNNRARGDSSQLALWQRRAIAKLATIDTKGPMRMEVKQPSTK